MKNSSRFSKLRVESLEERTLLAVMAGGLETAVRTVAPTESAVWVVNTLEDSWDENPDDDIISLREAIDFSSDGDQIVFDESLAGGTITLNSRQLVIHAGITIDASTIGGITIDANEKNRAFLVNVGNANNSVELISLSIMGGYADNGGGIWNADRSMLTLTNCTVAENTATNYGGGVFNGSYSTLTLINSAVSGNTANYDGGGIFNYYNSTLTLINSVVLENTARSGGGIYNYDNNTLTLTNSAVSGNTANYDGGGIFNYYNSTLTLINSVVSENTAHSGFGGIYSKYGTLTLTNCIVSKNGGGGICDEYCTMTLTNCTVSENNVSKGNGGGIGNWQSKVTMTDCTVAGNTAVSGGGIYSNYGTLTLTNCTVSGNTASGEYSNGGTGGGIYYYYGTLTLTNSTVTGNSASDSGGGIYNSDGTLTLTNCTVSGNIASGKYSNGGTGGGICSICNDSSATAYLYNTIIAQNTAIRYYDVYHSSGSIYAYNCLSSFTDWTESENCLVYDPARPLFHLGNGFCFLAQGSQAINGGNNSYISGHETDISGNLRIDGGTVDIGAYESRQGISFETPSTVVTTNLDVADPYDNLISLREAIFYSASGDTITFDDSLSGGTITLSGIELKIDKGITIDATAIGGITINADGLSRVFNIGGGDEMDPVELIGLTITGGNVTGYGGGIYNYNDTLILTNCTVSGNTADYGGGICNVGTLTLTNSTISGNTADYAGGIVNFGILTLTNCTASANTADYGGGIYNNGSLTITTSSITNNSGGEGGGILTDDGKLSITNSLISANSARYGGGGIYNYYSEVSIVNSTISANTANKFGGGIYNESDLVLTNSIVALNFAHGDEDILGTYSGENNLIGVDPSFVVSPVYREGYLVNADELDLSLSSRSAAINAGTNGVVETETDIAGNPRIVNGIVDIGAYEYGSAPPAEQLASPTILTGNKGVYVSAGANRQQITWDAIENASGYELTYTSDNRDGWTSITTSETSAVITGLTYGDEVAYRVRALGEGSYADSDWSQIKTFNVCPMDVNGDGDIGGVDRNILAVSWFAEEGDDDYIPAADIDGNGDVGGIDRAFLANNWLNEVGVDDMIYPRPQAADVVFSEFASADLAADLDVF